MKENKYDDAAFFAQYGQLPRSREGLDAAGEWHALRELMPALEGKRVLDLGCGFGWHCRFAAAQGAASVLGVDLSEKMLEVAREKTVEPNVRYERHAIEDFPFGKDNYDVVVSSLAIHYVKDFRRLCRNVNRCLAPGGVFLFSVEHPIFSARGDQDWVFASDGGKSHWPVDDYFREGRRTPLFLGERIVKYHRTLTTYASDVLASGFRVEALVEPTPPEHLLDSVEGMRDEMRRPMMLIVSARKSVTPF